MTNSEKKHFIVYGKGLSLGLIEKIAKNAGDAEKIPASQGTYIDAGMPYVEFWAKVDGHKEDYIEGKKKELQGSVVTIVQSVGRPYAENFAYAKLAANNAKRFGAKVVHMIFPFYDLREDKEFSNRGTSFSNPMYARELAAAGVDYVTFMAPHSKDGVKQFADVFGKNISVVEMSEIMIPLFKEKFGSNVSNLVNGAPDGWNKQTDQAFGCAVAIAKALHGEESYKKHLFGIEKERTGVGQSHVVQFHGDVRGKIVVSADDMFDGGGTSVHAAEQADKNGAAETYIAAAHGIFSKSLAPLLAARNKDDGLLIKQIIVTNSLRVEQIIDEVGSKFTNVSDRMCIADISPFVVREMQRVLEQVHTVALEATKIKSGYTR